MNLVSGNQITLKGALMATFMGAVSGAVTFGIGEALQGFKFALKATYSALAHGTFQGLVSGIQGGGFWAGFAAGSISSMASSLYQGAGFDNAGWHGLGGCAATDSTGMIIFGTIMGGAGAALTGGNFWQGAVTGLVVSGLNHAMHQIDPPSGKKTKVLKSTKQATDHYLNGDGSPAKLDKGTQLELHNSKEYLWVVRRLVSGRANNLNGSFDVDMEFKVFHVGSTNVDYSTNCAGGNCTTTFTEFVRDGYYDPDYIDENTLGKIGIPKYKADNLGPNLERFGGTPYMYIPLVYKITYPNPGY